MRTVLASFTARGVKLEKQLIAFLRKEGLECEGYTMERFSDGDVHSFGKPVREWCGDRFDCSELFIFIGASGIAVRSIAPWIRGKDRDPAVLVLDEKGTFVISLLSGHLGGANEWANRIAEEIGAIPVITTATDINQRFAVDVFSKNNDLTIAEIPRIKWISSAILAGEPVAFLTDLPEGCQVSVCGELPEGLTVIDREEAWRYETGIVLSLNTDQEVFRKTLHLLPKVVLGVGCKRDTEAELFQERVLEVLAEKEVDVSAVKEVFSIDLKAEERGILSFCETFQIPFRTFCAEELRSVAGEFSASAFVSRITGVDNVCERSAVRGMPEGFLLFPKTPGKGVTVAAVMPKNIELRF